VRIRNTKNTISPRTSIQPRGQGNLGLILNTISAVSLLRSVQTDSETHTSLYRTKGKAATAWSWPSPQVFMLWCTMKPQLCFTWQLIQVVFFLLGDSPASEFYVPTFRNTLSRLHRCCKLNFEIKNLSRLQHTRGKARLTFRPSKRRNITEIV